MGSFNNGVWNFVFLGCNGAPASHCGNDQALPVTTIAETPKIAEKPYIIKTNGQFKLMVPNYEVKKVGHTANWQNAVEIDFSEVYVASDKDTAATLNSKLSLGLHLVLQPGQYKLSESLKLNQAN